MIIVKKINRLLLLVVTVFFVFCCKNKETNIDVNNQQYKTNIKLDNINYIRYKESKTNFVINSDSVTIELSKIYYKNNGDYELYIQDNNYSKGIIIPFNYSDIAPDGVTISNKVGYNNESIKDGFVITFYYSKIFADYIFKVTKDKYLLDEIIRYYPGNKDVNGKQTDTLIVYSDKKFNQPIEKLSKKEIDDFINQEWSNLNCKYIIKKDFK